MKTFLHSAKFLLLDMASTVLFLLVYTITHSLAAAVALGVALGVAQIAWELMGRRPIDTMQWVSLVLVVASGTATLVTNDPRFMTIKLSVIYAAVGTVMLKSGWMNRYLPPIAIATVPDLGVAFGYVWAGLMMVSAVVNLVVARSVSLGEWAAFMSIYGTATKVGLFGVQYTTMRIVGGMRRRRTLGASAPAPELA